MIQDGDDEANQLKDNNVMAENEKNYSAHTEVWRSYTLIHK